MEWTRLGKNKLIMKFPKIPYLNQVFKPNPNSTVSYIWTGYAWDIYTDNIGNPVSEVNVVSKSSTEINGETPSGEVNGINTIFSLLNDPIFGTDEVYLNGLRQTRDLDYTIDGKDITFIWAPYEGANILCNYEILNGSKVEGEAAVLVDPDYFTKYSLTYNPIIGSEKVYINGLRAKFGAEFDYTIVDNIIHINYQLNENSRVLCDYNY